MGDKAKKTLTEIIEVLERPTPPEEVSFIPRGVRANQGSKKEGMATAIPYVDSAWVENMLDEAAGKFGWQSDVKQVAGVMCVGVAILNPDTGEWLWRWDVGLEKQQEQHGSKAEVTAALKRGARQWGIGRDLKDYPKPRLACRIWIGNDGKARHNSWIMEPREAVMKLLAGEALPGAQPTSTTTPTQTPVPAAAATPAPTPAATPAADQPPGITNTAAVSAQANVTPAQARKLVYDYAIQQIEMSSKEAAAWITLQETEHGKNTEAYRMMYGFLVERKKTNEPPEDWESESSQ